MKHPRDNTGWHHERTGCQERQWARVAGVDEAGRGPIAGPVVAACVEFPAHWFDQELPGDLMGLTDSKQVTAGRREEWFRVLTTHVGVRWAVSWVEPEEIDRINILQATHRAMRRCVSQLPPEGLGVLVDGRPVPGLPVPHVALVQGDALSLSIAAASILAKVFRDRSMVEAEQRWPGYGLGRHKGYPTPEHLDALARRGPCPWHRRSFAPVAHVLGSQIELPWSGGDGQRTGTR